MSDVDVDGDGSPASADCDDTNATVYPGADETCDGVDNDCDGEVDEDALDAGVYYRDGDGDGFGDADERVEACRAPSGYVPDSTDCDDTAAAVYVGAVEVCDGIDNDCDGATDDGDASLDASTGALFYGDGDGDGAGDPDDEVAACAAPSGYVAAPDDCNDDDPEQYPGAIANEPATVCGEDRDGDGWADALASAPYDAGSDCNDDDETEFPGAVAEGGARACMRDADGDGYGDAAVGAPYDAGTDCVDSNAAVYPGAATLEPTVCGIDADGDGWANACANIVGVEQGSDCNDSTQANGARHYPGAVAEGGATDCMEDQDEDGWGSAQPSLGDTVTGSLCYDAGTDCDDTVDATYPGAAPNDSTTACMQDRDGDGWGQANAPYAVTDGTDCDDRSAAVYPGAAVQEPALCSLDLDGDGYADLRASATYASADDGTDCDDSDPTIYLNAPRIDFTDGVDVDCSHGDNTNYPLVEEFGTTLRPSTTDARAGAYLDIGDVDGDGAVDLYVGSSPYGTPAYLLTGPVTAWPSDLDNATATWGGSHDAKDGAIGDLNGDGYDDLVQIELLTAYVYFGPVTGTLTEAGADSSIDLAASLTCAGGSHNARDYETVLSADVTADGQDDLVVSLPGFERSDCDGVDDLNVGGLFVMNGPLTGSLDVSDDASTTWTGEPSVTKYDGRSPAVVPDLDGDGVDDLVATRRGDAGTDPFGGRVLLDVPNHAGGVLPDEADLLLSGHYELAGAGDTNADGYGDLLGTEGQSTYLYLGTTTGVDLSAVASKTHTRNPDADVVPIAGGGDFNGDGRDDFIIEGTWLMFGPVTGSLSASSMADALFDWSASVGASTSYDTNVGLFQGLRFTDLDQDGYDDLLVGNVQDSEGANNQSGALTILWGE